MANFVAISGPSVTGKTSLLRELRNQLSPKEVIVCPDMHDTVWHELLDRRLFQEFTEIQKDTEYLCVYILKVIEYYHNLIKTYEKTSSTVLLDGCWLDLLIYSHLNMWYNSFVRGVQEDILQKVTLYDNKIKRIYITNADDEAYPVRSVDTRSYIVNFNKNRKLELQCYDIAKHIETTVALPSLDIRESAEFIIADLRNLGYIRES